MAGEATIMEGGCGCGAVRYRVTGAPKWASHLPLQRLPTRRRRGLCDVYRAAHSAGGLERRDACALSILPGVTRSFCGKCGTSLTYEGERCGQAKSISSRPRSTIPA